MCVRVQRKEKLKRKPQQYVGHTSVHMSKTIQSIAFDSIMIDAVEHDAAQSRGSKGSSHSYQEVYTNVDFAPLFPAHISRSYTATI